MFDDYSVPKEQEKILEAVEAVNVAFLLSGHESNLSISFHDQAYNNSPGWNIFLKNIRFEFAHKQSRMRFSLLPDEEVFNDIKNFIDNELRTTDYEITNREGKRYIIELCIHEFIYNDDGIEKISLLTNKILENS